MTKKGEPDAAVFTQLQGELTQANSIPKIFLISDSLQEIANDILTRKGKSAAEYWYIGKLLKAAKEKLTVHGEWLEWLADYVDIPDWMAERYMKLANEYANPTAPSILGFTKALAVTRIPADKRDEFLEGTHPVDGQEKTVVQMTTRELKKVIQEWKRSEQGASEESASPTTDDGSTEDIVCGNADQEKLFSNLDAAQRRLRRIKKNMKKLGPPDDRCASKLRDLYDEVLECMKMAEINM